MSEWFGNGLAEPFLVEIMPNVIPGPFGDDYQVGIQRIKVTLSAPYYEVDFRNIPGILYLPGSLIWERIYAINPLYNLEWIKAEIIACLVQIKEK